MAASENYLQTVRLVASEVAYSANDQLRLFHTDGRANDNNKSINQSLLLKRLNLMRLYK